MAKQEKRQKSAASKYIHQAAVLQKDKKKQLIKLIAAAVGGVVIWALYTYYIRNFMPNEQFDSIVVFMLCLCLVFFIGEVGNKYARFNAELRKLKAQWGITDAQIQAQIEKEKH